MTTMKLRSEEGNTNSYHKVMQACYVKQTPIIGLLPQIANKHVYSKLANGHRAVEIVAQDVGMVKNSDREFW